jgi:hypothetical protein
MAGGPGEAMLDGVVRGAGFSFRTARPRALAGCGWDWSWSWCSGYGCRSGLCVHITRAQRPCLCAVFTPTPLFYDPVVFLVRGHVPGSSPGGNGNSMSSSPRSMAGLPRMSEGVIAELLVEAACWRALRLALILIRCADMKVCSFRFVSMSAFRGGSARFRTDGS